MTDHPGLRPHAGRHWIPGFFPVTKLVFTDEIGDESVCGAFVKLGRCSDLLNGTCLHYDYPAGHCQSLSLVVRYENNRKAQSLVQVKEFNLEFLPQLEIQSS